MEAEDLRVLYSYEYNHKERQISITKDEKLKLLQRTNQHWWKVVRPGVNKAFFVPAQYVETINRHDPRSSSNNNNIPQSPESFCSPTPAAQCPGSISPKRPGLGHSQSHTSSTCRIKRTDSTRASKKAIKLKNWSASLEELSKQIVFPGINISECSTSVVNLQSHSNNRNSMNLSPIGNCKNNNPKPVPLPRKSVSEPQQNSSPSPPKPIPKTRMTISSATSSKSSGTGSSSEVLTTSSEEIPVTVTASASVSRFKEESRTANISNPKTDPSDFPIFEIKPKDLGYSNNNPTSIESFSCTKPLPPSQNETPLRILLDHWAEYINSDNRYYYYNSQSGATSWKPPRINSSIRNHDGSSLDNSHPHHSSSSLVIESETTFHENENNLTKEKQKSKVELLHSIPIEETQLPVQEGWTCQWNDLLGQYSYVHGTSGARWLCSQDPQGKIYYYEENSSKSSWFLPVPGSDGGGSGLNDDNSSLSTSKFTTSDSIDNHTEVSVPVPEISCSPTLVVKKRHSTGEVADRFMKSRSMLIIPDQRRNPTLDISRVGSLPRSQFQKSIWNSTCDELDVLVIKEGPLTRTKITENGKKLRKNWTQTYVVLTEEHLSLFKDEKTFVSSKKTELEIELAGSTVDWSLDKTSRKNVFQLNSCSDLQILFQAEDSEQAGGWIEAIREIIKRQPVTELLRLKSISPEPLCGSEVSGIGEKKGARLGRAKSTKLKISGSVENLTSDEKNKIRAQLKKFFHRRATKESLMKKGIYKDEAVFGCHLDKLCAREGGKLVPNFVQECVAAIESKEENLKCDGLYRASGNLSQVQKIRLLVDQNNLSCLYQEEDVHVLAGALKLFFREMKEPLISTELFDLALQASNLQSKNEKIAKFREIISKLAKPNRATLQTLLKHLLRVSEYSDFNRMLIPNLAIVFGPTLMWPATVSTNMALDLMQQNFVIEALLLEFDAIFKTESGRF